MSEIIVTTNFPLYEIALGAAITYYTIKETEKMHPIWYMRMLRHAALGALMGCGLVLMTQKR